MRYHNITHEDMLNGDGLRTVLWVAGCTHGCRQCQNPVTWDVEGGLLFDEEARAELMQSLEKDYIAGITLSGGDPLHPQNRSEIRNLVQEVKTRYPQKTIWLYTGFTWDELQELDFLPLLDVVVDGRFELDKRDILLHWRGSSNQRVIDVKETLAHGRMVLWSQ